MLFSKIAFYCFDRFETLLTFCSFCVTGWSDPRPMSHNYNIVKSRLRVKTIASTETTQFAKKYLRKLLSLRHFNTFIYQSFQDFFRLQFGLPWYWFEGLLIFCEANCFDSRQDVIFFILVQIYEGLQQNFFIIYKHMIFFCIFTYKVAFFNFL
jgi:hypothetical protein